MRILGLCHDVNVCSACVVVDGQVVAAIPEERLDRVKQSRVFPIRAIEECLRLSECSLRDIDEIAVGWNPGIELETIPAGYLQSRRWRTEHFMQVPARLLQAAKSRASHGSSLRDLWDGAPPITFVDHYRAHLGNAVFLSPWEQCAVLLLDGRGERQTGLLGRADGAAIEVLAETAFPHSLGLFYGAITQYLGFTPDSDEWKVMALAAYENGSRKFYDSMRRLIQLHENGTFSLALEHFAFYNFSDPRWYSDSLVELFGPPRAREDPITERHYEIAGALQHTFEEALTHMLTRLHERTGLDQVVVNGGCFMNSLFNGKITRVSPFTDCFVGSCPDDSGTSVGAALYLHAQRTGERPKATMSHSYWGTGFSDAECLSQVRQFRLPATEVLDDPSAAAAQDLVAGRLVGWFQGRAEFGQRALGNRSILADPRRADAKDVVNAAVKYRESFRPFAPAILAEKVAEWFECEAGMRVPYMEKVLPFRAERRAAVPAVVHQDGTGRLQTVDRDHPTPRYRQLIEHFERLTGVPIVLNTSFNLNGEPIVNSPQDAIRTFYSCGLDVLYLGNVRIAKAGAAVSP
jgi:carbamoyltransferase